MAKKIKAIIKLALSAGKANPAPPVGPALGQYGVNLGAFCKDYNAKTLDQLGLIIPAKVTVYDDKSYTFILKSPPASALLAKRLNIKKGSAEPNKQYVGSLTINDINEIALLKLEDLNTKDLQKAAKIILGTALSMGIKIKK